MTRFRLFHLKNEMLVANFFANLVSVSFVQLLMFRAEGPLLEKIWAHSIIVVFDNAFTILAFAFVAAMTLIYERPIRSYLTLLFNGAPIPPGTEALARRRLLNEPFVLIALDFSMWLLAAVLYPLLFMAVDADLYVIRRAVFHSLSVGLMTVTIAFFLLEHVSQRRMTPYVFPRGGLSETPGTIRIRTRTRLIALLMASNLIPLSSILYAFDNMTLLSDPPDIILKNLHAIVNTNAVIFVCVGILLTMLVGRNLSRPFDEILETLRNIRNGYFDKKVRVTSNDEIGYTGDVINEMAEGLRERELLRQSLELAKEIQQSLLPNSALFYGNLDIAGRSIYCDQTGGDYFDFIPLTGGQKGTISLVVGDVSGHGVPSALLMTTARAFLRLRSALPGSINQIVTDVNAQLTRDVETSGQFMTLFYLMIDPGKRSLRWVRAGHDPALLYDPARDRFEELNGPGIALGLDETWQYQEGKKSGLSEGQIIVIGTDGVWEAHNREGKMFGKAAFHEIIRQKSDLCANDILDGVLDGLRLFQNGADIEDDITVVVVKT